jgi:hypothetical protein
VGWSVGYLRWREKETALVDARMSWALFGCELVQSGVGKRKGSMGMGKQSLYLTMKPVMLGLPKSLFHLMQHLTDTLE